MVAVAGGQGHTGAWMVAEVELGAVQLVTSTGVVEHAPLEVAKRTVTKEEGKADPVKVMSSFHSMLPEDGLTA